MTSERSHGTFKTPLERFVVDPRRLSASLAGGAGHPADMALVGGRLGNRHGRLGSVAVVASTSGPMVKSLTHPKSHASRTLEVKAVRSCIAIPVRLLTNRTDSFIQEGKQQRKSGPAARSSSVVAGARS